MRVENIEGTRILLLDADGPTISTAEDTSDLVANAWSEHVQVIGVPVGRFDPKLFRLAPPFAAEMAQKAGDYRLRLAVIGDVRGAEDADPAFRDFVGECNRGNAVWFVPDEDTLFRRLGSDLDR